MNAAQEKKRRRLIEAAPAGVSLRWLDKLDFADVDDVRRLQALLFARVWDMNIDIVRREGVARIALSDMHTHEAVYAGTAYGPTGLEAYASVLVSAILALEGADGG